MTNDDTNRLKSVTMSVKVTFEFGPNHGIITRSSCHANSSLTNNNDKADNTSFYGHFSIKMLYDSLTSNPKKLLCLFTRL